jgi:hypothetical protein
MNSAKPPKRLSCEFDLWFDHKPINCSREVFLCFNRFLSSESVRKERKEGRKERRKEGKKERRKEGRKEGRKEVNERKERGGTLFSPPSRSSPEEGRK